MRPAEVLKQMKELREAWRKQSFSFTKDQQTEYDKLLKLRRERVSYFLKMVWYLKEDLERRKRIKLNRNPK